MSALADWTLQSWTWRDWLDLLVKLSPAATIIGAVIAAKMQFRSLQRLNAESIAKNHYRAMLETLLNEGDLIGMGSTPEGLAALRRNPHDYGRYRVLFGIVAFAMQEVYFATDAKHNRHWALVIRTFMGLFRTLLMSSEKLTSDLEQSVHPEFGAFVHRLLEEGSLPPAKPSRR